jgi:hypothetical protein
MIRDGFCSIDDGKPLSALIRVSADGRRFEYLSVDGWIEQPELAVHWRDPGSEWPVELDKETAGRLAERFGYRLAGGEAKKRSSQSIPADRDVARYADWTP